MEHAKDIALPSAPAAGAPSDVLAFPASVAQQMFWYLELLQGQVTAFNVPLRFLLTGPLDPALLEQTLNIIIDRHEALRTHFAESKGELLQIVSPSLVLQIPVIDISHIPAARMEEETDRLGGIEARRPFSLSTGPLIRAELLRLSPERHILHVTLHHAIFDGMSMTVLTREIAAIYQACADGRPCPLEPLPIQYGDYSVWQKEALEGPAMKQQLAYWKRRLEGMTELDLPTEFPRPPVKSWKGDIISTLLPKDLTDTLHSIAARHGATLFHLQLAAYMLLLHRYTGTTDVAVGTPVTGRTRAELEPVIGVFINSLILRCDLSGNPSFNSLVTQVRDTTLEALENQELPFECLVRELRPGRDQSRNPLFQVNFNHHRSFARPGSFAGVTLSPIPSRSPGTIFDLHFFMVERAEGWRASCDYSTDLFSRSSAERMLGHYKQLLTEIASHPDAPIDRLGILTDSENHQLRSWSRHSKEYPRDATIGSLFLETAARFPDRTALVCGKRIISYQQLRDHASHIALGLINAGIKPGDRVAIAARPGPEMIAGMLAILLAGGCSAPIDPAYPPHHFLTLLNACGAVHALATDGCVSPFTKSWPGTVTVIPRIETRSQPVELPVVNVTADHPAHLMFTSGSTGTPKGVLLPHRGTVRLVRNNDFIPITPDDVFLQAAPASFDASILEIWGPLLNGGRLVLLTETPTLEDIAAAVRDHGITTLWLTSGLFQLMIDEHADDLKSLRYLLAGGDVLSVPHVRKALDALPNTRIVNGYGPTENSTFTTCHTISREDLSKPSIPIGKPIANTSVFLLDDHLRQVPVGIPGELCTGGDGLAIGYLDSPELNREKFIDHPEFGRLYRTGDLCRLSPDGVIEFIGRRDHQVKVRGFRIELAEIEAALASHPAVRQAKAAVRGESAESKRILAWIVPHPGTAPTPAEILAHLAGRLPHFMMPEAAAVIEAFPLNANGKIQVASLPDPGQTTATSAAVPYEAPSGPIENHLAAIWKELLGKPTIGRHDDFFSLGGHSLMALRMFSRINREFQLSLPLATLLQHPTIARLAPLLVPVGTPKITTPPRESPTFGNVVTLSEGSGTHPLFCIHGGDGGVLFYRALAELLPSEIPFHAIESLDLGKSGEIQPRSIEETASSYLRSILAIQPQGPFRIAGYSFGGVVAHEIACQLTDLGHHVSFLGLFDTHNPAAPVRSYKPHERLAVFWRENADTPVTRRIGKLAWRIRQGSATHRKIRAEVQQAAKAAPAEPYTDLRRIQVREENWRAMSAYKPRPFTGRITLFKSDLTDDKFERPPDYGWSKVALSGLDIVSVPGHHLDLFVPEHIPSLASALETALKRETSSRAP